MKTIALDELGADAERIAIDLRRGERMILSYHGEPVAETVPPRVDSAMKMTPRDALVKLQEVAARDPACKSKSEAYLLELAEDRRAWGERSL